MAESRQEIFEVKSENGDFHSYVIRGLRDDEIETWAAFCASVFSYKASPPPASYFERHYRNDPSRVASLIRVAVYQDQMVASCRLFLRSVSMGSSSTPLSAGGIGEVCTAKDHRRRGLSKVLLQNVIEIMKERQLQVSLLHAAPDFFPVYETAGGYVCTESRWSIVPIMTPKLLQTASKGFTDTIGTTGNDTVMIREAAFPFDTVNLSRLHQTYSEQRFAGCILRSNDYWNEYLSVELKGSLWVLEVGGALVSWLSLRPRGDRFQLCEFGFDIECSIHGLSTSTALSLLLARAMKEHQVSSGSMIAEEWLLALPTFVLDECRSQDGDEESVPFVNWPKLTNDNDRGWMYKILDEKISIESINGSQMPHLIWPADSF